MWGDNEEVGFVCGEGGVCELFVGGGSTSATSVLLRRRYPLTVRDYLFTLAGRTNLHAYW